MVDSEQLKRILIYVLTVVILFCITLFIFFLYFVNTDLATRIVGTLAIVLLSSSWLILEYRRNRVIVTEEIESPISRFILMTRDGEREKEWHASGAKSFLIGKGTTNKEVDIELGDSQYSDFISSEHAVLNFTDGYWYIEDLESTNGVGIKKKGEEFSLRLKPLVAYKIDEGDIIYISKAKILVR